jgi:hypothetical protein
LIEDSKIAKQVAEVMQDCTARLNESVALVRDTCGADELIPYRRAVGKVMAEILLEVLNPLYGKHPSLKPPGFD